MQNEESIFAAAIGHIAPEERTAFLDAACAENPKLRARIEGLLWAHEHPDSFLNAADEPSGGNEDSVPYDATITVPTDSEPTGTTIGPYKLLQQIGEGGMGTVYMAEQTKPVQRRVALKLIKAGMDSWQVISRFEAERQALALMDHPHIAKVLDAGTTNSGLPYFVMELVKGVPITKYCDEHHLTPRQRLELFIPVCQAVQHAHQKGIIHRDLKPSNVLVARYDGKPVPKVIDFGVAKATGQRLTDNTLFTGFGTIVGTVEYMSPEQAEINQLDIDTRSDIYSLGVLLYELLAGSTPFTRQELEKAGMLEMLRVIREQEPAKPSTKLSTADGLPTLAANRGTEPAKLAKLVRGELDWIVMKALEKDRNRRYETANGFAMDVQRYLADEPVLACTPSAGYRLRKFVRRNKGPVLAASLLALALMGGVIGTTWGLLRATKAEADAVREAGQKTVALGEKEAALATATANEIQAKAAQQDAQENLKDALGAVDQMLTRVAEDKLLYVPQMEPIRRDLLLDALNFYNKFLGKQSDDPVIRQEAAHAYLRVGRIHHHLGQYTDAVRAYRNAFEMFDRLGPFAFAAPPLLRDMVNAHIESSWMLNELGNGEEAVQDIRRAVEFADKLDAETPGNRHYILNARNSLADHLRTQQPEEAEKILKGNLALADNDLDLGGVHYALGYLFLGTARSRQAEEAWRLAVKHTEQYAIENPTANWVQATVANYKRALAGSIAANQRLAEAEQTQRGAIFILDKVATDFPAGPRYRTWLADALIEDAALLKQLEQTADAEKAYCRAIDLYEKLATDFPTMPAYWQTTFDQRLKLGQFLVEAGRTEDALEVYQQAVDLPGKQVADAPTKLNPWQGLVRTHLELGRLLAMAGKKEEVEAAYRRATEIQERLEKDFADKQEYRRDLAQSHHEAANLLRDAGRPLEAEKLYGYAIPHFRKLVTEFPKAPEYRASLGYVHNDLAWLMRGADNGRLPQAEKEHRLSLALFDQLATDFPTVTDYQIVRADMLLIVASLLRARGDLAGLKPLKEAAISYSQSLLQAELRKNPNRQRLHKELVNLLIELGESAQAENSLRQALADCEKQVTESPAEPASWEALSEIRIAIANLLKNAGRSQEAECFYRLALAGYDKLVADDPTKLNHWQGLVRTLIELGRMLFTAGKTQEAEAAYREALATREKLAKELAESAEFRRALADAQLEHARSLKHLGQMAQAEEAYRRASALWEKLSAEFPSDTGYRNALAQAHAQLAHLLPGQQAEQEFRKAAGIYEELVAETHGEDAGYLENSGHNHRFLAFCVWDAGNTKEAEELFGKALNDFEQLSAANPDVASHWHFLADTHRLIGRLLALRKEISEAEKAHRRSVEIHDQRMARVRDQPVTPAVEEGLRLYELAPSYFDLATLLMATDRKQDAETVLRKFLVTTENLQSHIYRGRAYAELEEWQNAAAAFEQATTLTPDSPIAWYFLALVQLQRGDHAGYRMVCSRMLERFGQSAGADAAYWTVWTCVLGPDAVADWTKLLKLVENAHADNRKNYDALNHLGAVLYRAGRIDEAAQPLTDAEAAFKQTPSTRSAIAYNWLFQAMTQHRLGHAEDAASWLKKAVQDIDDPSPETAQVPATSAWNRRLTLQLLRREADELLKKESSDRTQESEMKSN